MTDDDRAAVLNRVLGDDILTSMIRLRAALSRFVRWPWSRRRQEALIRALEDVMALQVNRVVGTSWTVMEGPIRRTEEVRDDLTAVTAAMLDLEERVETLEDPPAFDEADNGK